MSLVLDASAALAWVFERPDPTERTAADLLLTEILTQPAKVPVLWHLEVANALLVAQRRGVAAESQVANFMALLSRLPIATDDVEVGRARDTIMALARQYQLTAYDAVYLELALRTGATLASFDQKLVQATIQAGGRVFGH